MPLNLSYKRYLPKNTPPQMKDAVRKTNLVFQVVLPGTVVQSNSTWKKGSYASWQLPLGSKKTLTAKSQVVRWRLVLLACALILVIFGGVGAWVIKTRAHKENNT